MVNHEKVGELLNSIGGFDRTLMDVVSRQAADRLAALDHSDPAVFNSVVLREAALGMFDASLVPVPVAQQTALRLTLRHLADLCPPRSPQDLLSLESQVRHFLFVQLLSKSVEVTPDDLPVFTALMRARGDIALADDTGAATKFTDGMVKRAENYLTMHPRLGAVPKSIAILRDSDMWRDYGQDARAISLTHIERDAIKASKDPALADLANRLREQDKITLRDRYLVAAADDRARDGELEVDPDAVISSSDDGAYVGAFIWVANSETGLDDEVRESIALSADGYWSNDSGWVNSAHPV